MPLYEYRCAKCGDVFEVIQKFVDAPLTVHAAGDCGGAVERLISTSALMFKGSGFYITDYAKSGSGGAKDKDKGSKSDSKSETKSDSKSDSKSGDSGSSSSTPAAAPAASTSSSSSSDSKNS